MFKVPFFADRVKPVVERCRTDTPTKLRLRYAPFYQVAEETDGLDIVVDGKRMVMMASNEYLGLTNHPQVRAGGQESHRRLGHQPVRLPAGQRFTRVSHPVRGGTRGVRR